MTSGIITHARVRAAGYHGIITHARVRTSPGNFSVITHARVRVSTGGTVFAGSTTTVEPGETALLVGSTLTGATPTSWDWAVLTGPTVTILGTPGDAARSYVAPVLRADLGTDVVFQLTAHYPGGLTSTSTVTHHINGHGGPWMYDDGGLLAPVLIHETP